MVGVGGTGRLQEEGAGDTLCCYGLTQGFPGHRTCRTKPGNIAGKLGLSWSPRGRVCEQRGGQARARKVTSEAMVRGLDFILSLMGMSDDLFVS